MESEGLKNTDGRKDRKKSLRSKGVRSKPNSGAAGKLKQLWADPEWRAKQLEKLAAGQAKRTDRGRLGVPDGMRKPEADKLWVKARESAAETMAELENKGVFANDDEGAKEALKAAVEVMRSPQNHTIKLAAARLVLEYTKSKPASKSEVTVNKAEEWLKAVAQDTDDDGEATEDAEASS